MVLPLRTLTTLNRQQLGEVFKDPRTLLAFERIQLQVATIIPETFSAFQNLDFVVTVADPSIPNAHVITAGANISVTPAAGLVTLKATPTGASGQIQYNNAGTFGAFTTSGDATINTSTGVLTLATVNSNVGSFGDSLHVATFTVNAKGLTTAAASVAIPTFAGSTIGLVPASLGGTVNYLRADGTFAAPPGSGGTVTSVASADSSITVTNPTTTVDLAVVKAPKLTTARTFSYTGDATGGPTSFDGSGNVSTGLTLANTAVTAGTYGDATHTLTATVDAKGRLTALSTNAISAGGTPGGSSGQIQYNNAGAFGGVPTVNGDGTLNTTTGALAVTKTGGVSFATSATTDTTNAANISSGNLPAARITTNLSAALDSAFGSTQGNILVRDTSNWVVLAAGSVAGQALCSNGASTTPSYQPVGGGGGGGLILLEQHTASNSAALSFTSWYSASYDEYMIEFLSMFPVTGTNNLLMRVSTNGGSTYDSGSNYVSQANFGYGGTTVGAAGGTNTSLSILGSNWSTHEPGGSASVKMINPGSTSHNKPFMGQFGWWHDGVSTILEGTVYGYYASNTAINALQFFASSGNISSGTIRIYGIAH